MCRVFPPVESSGLRTDGKELVVVFAPLPSLDYYFLLKQKAKKKGLFAMDEGEHIHANLGASS